MPGACRKSNMVYCITCLDCKAEGRNRQYWGETYRTMGDRIQEHVEALDSGDTSYGVVNTGKNSTLVRRIHQSMNLKL